MAATVELLLDHDIAVYGFREPASFDAEVYYATRVQTDSYFQGHYLKSVSVEKESETVDAEPGWFWVPTAQSMGRLITYLMEPETDDNLITWGFTDHILQETPESAEAAAAGMLGGRDMSELTEEQREQVMERAQQMMERRQQVPMIRVPGHQKLPVVRLAPGDYIPGNRFYR